MNAGDILTLLRHLNIPCSIDSFAAMGWTAKLGDPAKGFYAQQSRFPTLDAAASWLIEEARRQYPDAMPVSESIGSQRRDGIDAHRAAGGDDAGDEGDGDQESRRPGERGGI